MTTLTVTLSDDILATEFLTECKDAGTPANDLITKLICDTVRTKRQREAEAQKPPVIEPDRTAVALDVFSDNPSIASLASTPIIV